MAHSRDDSTIGQSPTTIPTTNTAPSTTNPVPATPAPTTDTAPATTSEPKNGEEKKEGPAAPAFDAVKEERNRVAREYEAWKANKQTNFETAMDILRGPRGLREQISDVLSKTKVGKAFLKAIEPIVKEYDDLKATLKEGAVGGLEAVDGYFADKIKRATDRFTGESKSEAAAQAGPSTPLATAPSTPRPDSEIDRTTQSATTAASEAVPSSSSHPPVAPSGPADPTDTHSSGRAL